jgi:hypothetical protein
MIWDRRMVLAATFVALFVVVQFAVPVLALFGPRPGRGGWQMYSSFPHVPSVWLIDAAGHEAEVAPDQLFVQLRAEIDFAAALRAGVCDASGAVAVKLSDSRGTTEVIECR